MERRGCKKVGQVHVFLDGLLEKNSWGRAIGGGQVDRKRILEVKCVEIVVRVIVGRTVLNLISVYAPQAGRNMQEKEEFFTSLVKIVSEIDDGERLLICGD